MKKLLLVLIFVWSAAMGADLIYPPMTDGDAGSPGRAMVKIGRILEGSGSGALPVTVVGQSSATPQGGLYGLPAGTATGTELPNRPSVTSGVRFYLSGTSSFTFFVGTTGSTYGSIPNGGKTVTYTNSGGPVDEPLSATDAIFITSSTNGTINYRYVQF